MTRLRFDHLGFAYDDTAVIEGLDFTLPPGKLTVLMGPSGCGKSTLMALAAGLLAPDRGRVIR
ncbi:MAG: ATP-binding cassette domain-containing protein, partial [Maritimibacter sp.]|nr:ATP-binding cassette domain-containing protein [Maritimibacter sp.]